MAAIDRIRAGLRPRRSANRPMTRPPTGLARNPTPNVAKVSSSGNAPPSLFAPVKKCLAMTEASSP